MDQFNDPYALEEDVPFAEYQEDPNRDTRDRVQAGYCCQCWYDLMGVPITGLCPECGTPVEESEPEMQLANTGLDYVSSLLNGTRLIKLAVA